VRTCLTLHHHCATKSLCFLLCRTLDGHGQQPSNAVRPFTGARPPSVAPSAPRLVRCGAQHATATPSTGATGQRHILGTVKCLPRTTTTPGAMPHSARQQEPSTVLPRFGEKGTTPEITRACNPSLLESIKGGGELPLGGEIGAHRQNTHTHSH